VSASGVAQQGGVVVGQVVDTMDGIQQLAPHPGHHRHDRRHRLPDQHPGAERRGGGPRGRAGRGFAVVAGEVRSLAQRCAGAAREIKTLISSSVEQVEAGSRLVADAGATMAEVVQAVRGSAS
jgi:methyl-accepting chemotaxis protein